MPITEVMSMAVVFGSFIIITKMISETMTRHRLIKAGMIDEKVKYLFAAYSKTKPLSNIKWGMILVGLGLAIFIREFWFITDETMLGLMFLFAGIAFLAYYFIAKEKLEENDNKQI